MAEPMSDERLAEIRQIAANSRAVVARRLTAALNELLAEVDRLNVVLDANRVVRNAAESSSRTCKGVVELLKAERTQLRAELAEMRAEATDPYNPQHIAQAVKRARRQRDEAVEAIAAERDEYVDELAELREQMRVNTEWAVYWVGDGGEPYEKQFLQDDEDEARSIVHNNHTSGRGDATLWQRPAGEWRKVANDE